jgi:6-phosphogluconolactonase
MDNIIEHKFENRDLLLNELQAAIFDALSNSVKNHGKASMLLSGGTSPGLLYKKLSTCDLQWEKVWFGLTDERWVDSNHIDSNERLVRETLLQNNAKAANFIGLKSEKINPEEGLKLSSVRVAKLPMPFDIILLGMGTDGHIASLFPDSADTHSALDLNNDDLCHIIKRSTGDVTRITMTLKMLMKSKQIILLFYGDEKIDLYSKAKLSKTPLFPVSYILHQNKVPISLYWAE